MGFETNANWRDALDPREQKEIDFAEHYAQNYAHGTPGHAHLMLLAKLARKLDELSGQQQRQGQFEAL